MRFKMGPKKKSKVIFILIIVLVVLILLTGIIYAYFATDTFKSNKELFFKYMTQMGDKSDGFIDTQLEQYFEKRKNVSYANEGTLALNIASENGNLKEYDTINNFNISFSGQTDKRNRLSEQNISLNYSDEVTFPINYRKIEDNIGLQTKYVSSKYITVDTQELENQTHEGLTTASEFLEQSEKLGNLTQLPFKEEDWKRIQETYINVLNTQLQDTQFSKIEEGNAKGYKLTLNGEETKNLMIQLLDTLKNDQATIDKINEKNPSGKLTTSEIDNAIKNIEKSTSNDASYEISVYQEKGKTNKVVLATQEAKIQLEKQKEQNMLQYIISYTENESNAGITLRANYTGLATMQNIQENYELEIQINVEDTIMGQVQSAKNNTKVLEEKEKISLLAVEAIIANQNNTITKEELKQIQQEDETGSYDSIEIEQKEDRIVLTFIDTKDQFEINEKGEFIKEPEQTSNTADSNNTNIITYQYQYNNQINFTDSVEIEEFSDENAMILNDYEEEQVNNFLKQVEERIKKVNKQQMEELGLKENENPLIQMFMMPFWQSLTYSQAAGAISNSSNMSELEVITFNQKFENYEGTNLQGVTVKGLLSTIQLNNESQEDENKKIKEIHFDGEEYEVTDPNIVFLKSSVETETAYRVEFERDENTGMIYRAVINKK